MKKKNNNQDISYFFHEKQNKSTQELLYTA